MPSPRFHLRFDLRRLILLLTITTALLTLANTFYASYLVQQDLLIRESLEANRVYAVKLAETTEHFLAGSRQQLAFSASQLSERMDDSTVLTQEVDRLRLQTANFNSVLVVDATGTVLATSPQTLQLVSRQLKSPGALQALREQRPLISAPYISAAGNLVVNISHPIRDRQGHYLGYLGASIYLQQNNILYNLLGEHHYKDGSYLYVVDREGGLLYHPDPARIGEVVHGNPVIEAVNQGHTGSQRLVNSRGVDMLAGYAPVTSTGWGVVAQRPTASVLAKLESLMLGVLRNAIPFSLLSLLAIWGLARLIAQPLSQLANTARQLDSPAASEELGKVRSWYYEAAQLKRALLAGLTLLQQKIGKLNLDSLTDPLSGLLNRRGLQITLEQWRAREQPFAVLALDIDHFKQINDNHGHEIGDQAIRHLADLMRECSRRDDVLCRSGGEEFIMLLPGTGLEGACLTAERLRLRTEASEAPGGIRFTVSAGVAHWPACGQTVEGILQLADQALYRAKREGRNRVGRAEEQVAPLA
ncbi:diguanylate cyclase (GGDEF) domain-containing protein [Pseudomonas linyingensis]|uniref:diguanylate cyclase n=1 Tax=Pseudomonas linyingensis TaxID=915471 RepID=A0A1H6WC98_9PSED|nr:sensor domain-containing diguanylate cyclase [Pseudomonas linyingensis]SEJ14659.1 diguanylate cyclase (GGDEF) domain-containing protein [Pseudomonas linyingensis]